MPITRTPFSRLWLIENGAGPAQVPLYLGQGKAGAPSWAQGDLTPVYAPSQDVYGEFTVIDKVRGARGLPILPVMVRYEYSLSTLLRVIRRDCDVTLQVHFGKCQDVRDFNGGWDKIVILEKGRATDYGVAELGAFEPGEDAPINETVPFSGEDYYELKRLAMVELGQTELVQEVVDVTICDRKTCGACGIPSGGCDKVFALTLSAGGSPGLPAELIYSENGGTTLGQTNVATLGAAENPSAMACVGKYLVVISNDSISLHYAPIADILDGTEAWTEVATGFGGAGAPNDLFSLGSQFTWIVGDGGYIYFTDDPANGVSVQTAGGVTVENLNVIHGFDENNLVAVGASNSVLLTRDGGATWASITGPAVGVALNTVWMRSEDEWFVGSAGGRLYYTRDAGQSWTEKAFPGSGAGVVRDIVFATPSVGYLSHNTATPAGRVLRTIDGGYSWYVLPEGTGSIPSNDGVNALAACEDDPNVVFGGGLGDNAIDGFLVKGS